MRKIFLPEQRHDAPPDIVAETEHVIQQRFGALQAVILQIQYRTVAGDQAFRAQQQLQLEPFDVGLDQSNPLETSTHQVERGDFDDLAGAWKPRREQSLRR